MLQWPVWVISGRFSSLLHPIILSKAKIVKEKREANLNNFAPGPSLFLKSILLMKNFSTFPKYLFSINESVKSPFAAFQMLAIFSEVFIVRGGGGKQTIKEFSNKNLLQTKKKKENNSVEGEFFSRASVMIFLNLTRLFYLKGKFKFHSTIVLIKNQIFLLASWFL